ncbi:MAG TPA: gephyrin-like molybdotransferase Glp [Solirubrobacteraceae bacterium]|nr:gephyrin-like molybdotransferase Glp [Solirubrobacteraceae bacterium]
MPDLLSIDQARAAVLEHVRPLGAEELPVDQALGRHLAADVVAAADVPGFRNSAMDGFAVRSGPAGRTLAVVGESRAGAPFGGTVHDGQAIRISTGAALPDGTDAVLQVELAEEDRQTGTVTLGDDAPAGRNVREPGEDVRAGETVLRAGELLGPAGLGVAVAAGRGHVACRIAPTLAILTTGDELVPPGEPLGPGQLHNSNAVTLAALARRAGGRVVVVHSVADRADATRAGIAQALAAAHVVILSGGVSVGPHDHVKGALAHLGVREVFWRVALRPGKPTWFGTYDGRLVFGLPGNPVSSMVTFLLFARPALVALQGGDPRLRRERARLAVDVERSEGRDECVRVHLEDGVATPTGDQASHRLSSMLGADALALVPRGDGALAAGSEVEVELLGGWA